MKKKRMLGLVAAMVAVMGLTGCGGPDTPPDEAEHAAARAAVKATLKDYTWGSDWRFGPLYDKTADAATGAGNGTAVLVNDLAAWWVRSDGTVYAANGPAKKLSPHVGWAPQGITASAIRKACGG